MSPDAPHPSAGPASGTGTLTGPDPRELQAASASPRLPSGASAPGPRMWGWLTVSGIMLVGLAPVLVIAATPLSEASSSAWVWAWLLTVVVGARYSWLVAMAPQRLFEIVVWLFTYVFLGLAPLAQMRSGRYPGTTPDLDTSLNGATMGIVWAGAVAFALGLALRPPKPGRRPAEPAPEVSTHRLLAFTALAVLFSAYYASRVGVGPLFSTRAERVAVENAVWSNSTVLAVVKAAATLPLVVAFSGLMRLRHQRRAAGGRQPVLLPVLVLLAMAVTVSPVSSPRYLFGTAALAVLVALGAASTAARARWLALLLAAGLVLVFPYADLTRRPGGSTAVQPGPAQALSSSDFDAFDMVNNALAFVQSEGTTGGKQALGAALFWVPRAVWEDKPRDTGILLAAFRDYPVSNLSSPLWAELFIDGGWVLVAVGMTGLGLFVRRLDRHAGTGGDAPVQRGVLADILPFYFIIMLRGSLLQSMAGFSVLALSSLVVTSRSRAPR